jgi:hypothetical protein
MLIATMNFGKDEGLISAHSLNDVRLPTVIKSDAPVALTKRKLVDFTSRTHDLRRDRPEVALTTTAE